MAEKITTQTIIDDLQNKVEQKIPIGPHVWTDAASKLIVLISDEHDKLYELQQQVAILRVTQIENGDTVAKANVYVEASDLYREMMRQKAKIGQIEEFIRIAKIRARLADNEYRMQ